MKVSSEPRNFTGENSHVRNSRNRTDRASGTGGSEQRNQAEVWLGDDLRSLLELAHHEPTRAIRQEAPRRSLIRRPGRRLRRHRYEPPLRHEGMRRESGEHPSKHHGDPLDDLLVAPRRCGV